MKPRPQKRPPGPRTTRPPAASRPVSSRGQTLLAGGLLIVLTLVSYSRTFSNDFIWDDDYYVTKNPTLRSADGLAQMWLVPRSLPQWYPLVHTTFWIEYRLWELDAAGYHAVNLLLHAASVLLLWRILLRLEVPGALLAATIFAVHPVEVESVAWITERKNVLSLLLALGSLWCYLRFSPADGASLPGDAPEKTSAARAAHGNRSRASGRWGYYFAALLLFVAALLSKTVVATLPAVILVLYWWKRGRIGWSDVWPLVPFFVVGAGLGSVTAWLEQYHVGAQGDTFELPAIHRCLIAGRALWFYAGKLAWPYPTIFFYPRWHIDAAVWWQYLFPLAALSVMGVLWLARNRMGRGPLAAVLIFAGVLTPALGFFNVYPFRYSFVADHFQYHASVALIALAAAGGAMLWVRLRSEQRTPALVATGVVLVVLAGITFHQTRAYKNLETICQDAIAKNPYSWVAYQNLADEAADRHDHDLAVRYCQTAVDLDPSVPYSHNALGLQFLFASRYPQAAEQFQQAIDLAPTFPSAHNNLGDALVLLGDVPGAVRHYQQAIANDPGYATPHCGLGRLLASQGRLAEAQTEIEEAVRVDPNSWLAHDSLGLVLRDRGQLPLAIGEFLRALQIQPDELDISLHLAETYRQSGQPADAIFHLERAAHSRPRDAGLRVTLARLLAETGQRERADVELRNALRIDPANAAALELLGTLQPAANARPGSNP